MCVHFVEYNLFSTLSDISNVSLKIPESHNSVMAVGILAHDFLYSLVLENLKPTSLKNIFFLTCRQTSGPFIESSIGNL